MQIQNLLERVCEKTIAEQYSIPEFTRPGDFFEWVPELGMRATQAYLEQSVAYKYVDMQYASFDWHQGVGFFSLMYAEQYLKTDRYSRFVRRWVDPHLESGLIQETVNTTAPFLCVLELYKQTGEQKYYDACEARARFCMARAARADEGAFEHTVVGVPDTFRSQIWADTLFMAALFLARWGAYTGNEMYLHEAVRQLKLHYKYLRDEKNGLLYHAYNCRLRSHMSAVHWGRANGWGIIAGLLIYEQLPTELAERSQIRRTIVEHLHAMAKVQEKNGGFHTVLDKEDTYLETTATAAFFFGVYRSIKLGWLGEVWRERAQSAGGFLHEHIAQDGTVEQASGGTPVMYSTQEYNAIPCVMSYYGQGIAALALCEEFVGIKDLS